MADEKYTLAGAVVELARRQCAAEFHAPSHRLATLGNPIGYFRCDCGKVRWEAHHD